MRSALLAEFGALEVGTKKALERINHFYRRGNIVMATFLNHKVLVHSELQTALARAEALLPADEREAIAKQITKIGGCEIRANTNNPLYLSEHSFGGAIDINAEQNPNVPDFPFEFIAKVTGVDLRITPTGHLPDVYDLAEILWNLVQHKKEPAVSAELERLLAVSRRLTDLFKDDTSLAAGMWAVARRMSRVPSAVTPADLLAKVRAAQSEGSKIPWRYQDPKAATPKRIPEGAAHDALADLLYPSEPGYWRPEPFEIWNEKRLTVELLIQMADVYERSFARNLKGRAGPGNKDLTRIKPEARAPAGEAALPQLVAHGFANLPARLVSVLRGPDGGDLVWLGTSVHMRDFMHFELKKRPARY